MAMEGDYFLFNNFFSIGPLIQIGVSDNLFLLGPTCNFKGVFDLPAGGFARRVKPLVQGGVGFAYANPKGAGDDVSFMFNMGFGVDIYLTTHFLARKQHVVQHHAELWR